jgi:hypothetical protein
MQATFPDSTLYNGVRHASPPGGKRAPPGAGQQQQLWQPRPPGKDTALTGVTLRPWPCSPYMVVAARGHDLLRRQAINFDEELWQEVRSLEGLPTEGVDCMHAWHVFTCGRLVQVSGRCHGVRAGTYIQMPTALRGQPACPAPPSKQCCVFTAAASSAPPVAQRSSLQVSFQHRWHA